jgi:hypothetical protein
MARRSLEELLLADRLAQVVEIDRDGSPRNNGPELLESIAA